MALELPIASQISTTETVIKDVPTSTTHIGGIYFDFDDVSATIVISRGTGSGEFYQELNIENWKFSGEYYLSIISSVPQGTTMAEVLLSKIVSEVQKIEADTVFKSSIIENRNMIISSGGRYFIGKRV